MKHLLDHREHHRRGALYASMFFFSARVYWQPPQVDSLRNGFKRAGPHFNMHAFLLINPFICQHDCIIVV